MRACANGKIFFIVTISLGRAVAHLEPCGKMATLSFVHSLAHKSMPCRATGQHSYVDVALLVLRLADSLVRLQCQRILCKPCSWCSRSNSKKCTCVLHKQALCSTTSSPSSFSSVCSTSLVLQGNRDHGSHASRSTIAALLVSPGLWGKGRYENGASASLSL